MLEGTLKSITLRTDQGMEQNFSSLEEGTNLKVPRFFRNVTPLAENPSIRSDVLQFTVIIFIVSQLYFCRKYSGLEAELISQC